MAVFKIHAIDDKNDWTCGEYKTNNDGLAQNIKTKLQEWIGDCFFNVPTGIDWTNRLANPTAKLQQEVLLSEIRALILQIDGVVNVEELNATFNRSTRNLSVDYNVNTVFNSSITSNVNITV